jgi:hypothetical protein
LLPAKTAVSAVLSGRIAHGLSPPIRITNLRGSRCPKDFCSKTTLTCIRITLPGLGKSYFDAKRAVPASGQSLVASGKSRSDADQSHSDATSQIFATKKLFPAQGRLFPIPGKGFPGQGKPCPMPGEAYFAATLDCFAATPAGSTAGAGLSVHRQNGLNKMLREKSTYCRRQARQLSLGWVSQILDPGI